MEMLLKKTIGSKSGLTKWSSGMRLCSNDCIVCMAKDQVEANTGFLYRTIALLFLKWSSGLGCGLNREMGAAII